MTMKPEELETNFKYSRWSVFKLFMQNATVRVRDTGPDLYRRRRSRRLPIAAILDIFQRRLVRVQQNGGPTVARGTVRDYGGGTERVDGGCRRCGWRGGCG